VNPMDSTALKTDCGSNAEMTGDISELGSTSLIEAAWLLWSKPAAQVLLIDGTSARKLTLGDALKPADNCPGTLVVVRSGQQRLQLDAASLLIPDASDLLRSGELSWYVERALVGSLASRLVSLGRFLRDLLALRAGGNKLQRCLRLRAAGGSTYRADVIWGPDRSVMMLFREALVATMRGDRLALCFSRDNDCLLLRVLAFTGESATVFSNLTLHFGSGRVFRVATPHHIVRMPRGTAAVERCRNAFQSLRLLESLNLPFAVPRALQEGTVVEQKVFVESRIPGRELAYLDMSPPQLLGVRRVALRLLLRVHQETCRYKVLGDAEARRLVSTPFEYIHSLQTSDTCKEAARILEHRLITALAGQTWPMVLSHGDFKIANLMRSEGGDVCGIVDWDRSALWGLPAVDVLHYLAFDRSLMEHVAMSTAIVSASRLDHDQPEVSAYCTWFAIDRDRWLALGAITLIHHIAGQVSAGARVDQTWLDTQASALIGAAATFGSGSAAESRHSDSGYVA